MSFTVALFVPVLPMAMMMRVLMRRVHLFAFHRSCSARCGLEKARPPMKVYGAVMAAA